MHFSETNVLFLKKMLKQWMIARSHVKINAVYFKKWLTATFSVTKINTLLQSKDGCTLKEIKCLGQLFQKSSYSQ